MTPTQIDKRIQQLAQTRVREPKAGGQRVIAGLYTERDKLLGWGMNSYKTHPLMAQAQKVDWGGYLHAEVAAIVNTVNSFLFDYTFIPGLVMVVVRVVNIGDMWYTARAEPCQYCKRVIADFEIDNVYWSEDGVRVETKILS